MTGIYCKNCGKLIYESEGDDLENKLCRRCMCTCVYPKRNYFSAIYFIRDFQDLKIIIPINDKDKISYQRNGLMKAGKVYLYFYNIIKNYDIAYVPFYRINPQPGKTT